MKYSAVVSAANVHWNKKQFPDSRRGIATTQTQNKTRQNYYAIICLYLCITYLIQIFTYLKKVADYQHMLERHSTFFVHYCLYKNIQTNSSKSKQFMGIYSLSYQFVDPQYYLYLVVMRNQPHPKGRCLNYLYSRSFCNTAIYK